LQRIADALEIPVYRLLLADPEPAHERRLPVDSRNQRNGSQGKKVARVFAELRKHLSRMCDEEKVLLVSIAEKMAGRHSGSRFKQINESDVSAGIEKNEARGRKIEEPGCNK